MARSRPIKTAAGLSVQALTRMLKILDKLDDAKAVDRMLKMLTKVEKTVDQLERLMDLIANFQVLSSALSGKAKKRTKKARSH